MKEYLHLFTPLAEIVLDDGEQYFIRVENQAGEFYTSGLFQGGWAILFGSGWSVEDEEYRVTHVLDLSKLTTKERAMEAIEAAYMSAVSDTVDRGPNPKRAQNILKDLL